MTPTATATDASTFLNLVRETDLAATKPLERALAALPVTVTAKAAADHLVAAGLLTRFQATRLLAGKADGFHLGQYVILEPLGRGSATGRVYKARHRTMNRLVAIKVLAADRTQSPAARESFHREARTAARLAHPNVVTALDANQVADRLYFVLEYVEGTSAEGVVRNQGPLPVARACDFIRQAALGIQHAHERGLAHGRIGPANLLVGRPGGTSSGERPIVKVLNFGLVGLALFDAGHETGNLNSAADAAEFLAPEQFHAPDASPKADLYSLGCTLYYLLTGGTPRATGDAVMHQFGATVPVEKLRPDVPPALADIVRKLMAFEPAARPVAAADVALWLAPLAAGDSGTIDFALPTTAQASAGSGLLSGLRPGVSEPASPFADIDADLVEPHTAPTLEVSGAHTPLATRKPRRRKAATGTGTMLVLALLALGIIVATAAAIGLVVRAQGR